MGKNRKNVVTGDGLQEDAELGNRSLQYTGLGLEPHTVDQTFGV